MTIQFQTNHSPLPNQLGTGDSPTGPVHHSGAPAPVSLNPASWHDVPPDLSTHAKHHSHTEGSVTLPPPPAGDTDPTTQQNLTDKFGQFLNVSAGNNARNENDGGGDGGGNPLKPPTHHFDSDDLMMLLITEGAESMKLYSAQTQLATTERITALSSEVTEMLDAAKDTKFAGILGGVGTMAAGATQVASAGINLKGVSVASKEIDLTAEEMTANDKGTLDAISKAQMFNRLTASYSAWGQVTSGSGQMLQGGMNVWQSIKQSDANKHDAAKAEDEKAAVAAEALHDNAQNMKQQAMQVMQDYVDRGKNMEQSRDQTMKAIARI